MEEKYRKGYLKGVLKVIEKLIDIIPATECIWEKRFSTVENYKRLF